MALPVATDAKCDEIFFDVIPQRTPELNVMNLKIPSSTATLATPPIPLQHSSMQRFVGFPIDSQSGAF